MYSKFSIFKEIIVRKMGLFTMKSRITTGFSGYANLRKNEPHFVPRKCNHICENVSASNEPSYIYKFTIWTEQQKKALTLPPMEKQLRILPHMLQAR